MPRRWLLLIYTVPTTPSRTRAYVWREIRRRGAVLLRDGVAASLDEPASRTWAREVANKLAEGGGTAATATASFDPAAERRLIAAFQKERAHEYAEVLSSCTALLEHIERERAHAEFSFEELEELEADLGKIRRWLADVRARDRFGSPAAARAQRSLATCEGRLAQFAERASHLDLSARAEGPLARPMAAKRTRRKMRR